MVEIRTDRIFKGLSDGVSLDTKGNLVSPVKLLNKVVILNKAADRIKANELQQE